MEINKENWLSNLNNLPDDIKGYKTCTYFTALEGWRRGLELKFQIQHGQAISQGITYTLSDGKNTHTFRVARGDKVTKSAIEICQLKPKTYEYMRMNNIPIPEGSDFQSNVSDDIIIDYARKIGFPLVVKPTDAGGGRGVITGIETIEQFKESLNHVRNELGFKAVIVERFIKAEDYRVYVVDNSVIGIYKRIPANVIGDGVSTIKELIYKKNIIRKKNPFISNRMIKIDSNLKEYLAEQDLALDSVIKEGNRIYLRKQGEYLKERDPVDITDEVSDEIKNIAVNAMKSIPGLTHCDVDMLVNEESGKCYVNEINSRPQISNHLFPLEGKARDIPKAIIDYYFPDTINEKRNDNYYFDFNLVYDAYLNNSVQEIQISPLPFDHQLTRFRVSGNIKGQIYNRWIRRQMKKLKMYGYVKRLKNGQTSVVVSGTTKSLTEFRNIIHNEAPNGIRIKKVKEHVRTLPITLNIKMPKHRKQQRIKNQQIQDLTKKIEKLQKELAHNQIKPNKQSSSLSSKIKRKLFNK